MSDLAYAGAVIYSYVALRPMCTGFHANQLMQQLISLMSTPKLGSRNKSMAAIIIDLRQWPPGPKHVTSLLPLHSVIHPWL